MRKSGGRSVLPTAIAVLRSPVFRLLSASTLASTFTCFLPELQTMNHRLWTLVAAARLDPGLSAHTIGVMKSMSERCADRKGS